MSALVNSIAYIHYMTYSCNKKVIGAINARVCKKPKHTHKPLQVAISNQPCYSHNADEARKYFPAGSGIGDYRMWIMTAIGWRYFAPVCCNHNNVEGIYRPQELATVRENMRGRIERFIEANDGSRPNNAFRGNSFAETLLGAFGERL